MTLLLAFDSFKDSMTSREAAQAFAAGFLSIAPKTRIRSFDISDGGEGFIDAMTQGINAKRKSCVVAGPRGKQRRARYAVAAKQTAIIEAAQANGIEHLSARMRKPLLTSSYGVGQIITHAMDAGALRVDVGLGGSATVDGGTGLAQALGLRFRDHKGAIIRKTMCGGRLNQIASIDSERLDPRLKSRHFRIACDVKNPMCGKRGAAPVFGPQKGATADEVQQLSDGLEQLAAVVKRDLGVNIRTLARGGAAGGLGAMLFAIAEAKLLSGIDLVLDACRFNTALKSASLVVTGEGSLDRQSVDGKVISGILARTHGVPVMAVGGRIIESEISALYARGLSATLPLVNGPMPLEDAIAKGASLMKEAGVRAARLVHKR